MPVPKAAMNKNYCFVFPKNNIWFSGELIAMQTVPKSISEQKFSNQHLRFCVLRPDLAHVITSYIWLMYIHLKYIKKNERLNLQSKNELVFRQ